MHGGGHCDALCVRAEEPECNSDGPIAARKARRTRKAAPKKCMADEATDDEDGKEDAAEDAEPAAAAKSTAKKGRKDCAGAISDELLKLRLEAAPEAGGEEAERAGPEADKENALQENSAPEAAAGDAAEDGELSYDNLLDGAYLIIIWCITTSPKDRPNQSILPCDSRQECSTVCVQDIEAVGIMIIGELCRC